LALGPANKKRIEDLQHNNYTFQDPIVMSNPVIAPPLNYNNTALLNTTIAQRRSAVLPISNSSNSNVAQGSTYSLLQELIDAARVVAESERTTSQAANYSAIEADLMAHHGLKGNDTNKMPQAIRHPDGLFEFVGRGGQAREGYETVQNGSESLVTSRAA
jgi:hypothetical protein